MKLILSYFLTCKGNSLSEKPIREVCSYFINFNSLFIDNHALSYNVAFFLFVISSVSYLLVFVTQLFKYLPRLSPKVANIFREMKRH